MRNEVIHQGTINREYKRCQKDFKLEKTTSGVFLVVLIFLRWSSVIGMGVDESCSQIKLKSIQDIADRYQLATR